MTTFDFPPEEVRRRQNFWSRLGVYFLLAIAIIVFIFDMLDARRAEFSIHELIHVTVPLVWMFLLIRRLPRYSDKADV